MTRARRHHRPVRRLALVLLALTGLLVAWGLLAPVGGRTTHLISVQRGESVSNVATQLQQRGLLRSADLFVLASYATGRWRKLQTGRYEFDGSMSALAMLEALSSGTHRAWRWLTIPEGYNLHQIAEQVQSNGLGSAAAFLEAARDGSRYGREYLPVGASLEGFLFPETYRVESEETEADIIEQMLNQFDSAVWRGLFKQQATYGTRSLHDILTLASLVEWEARKEAERPVIAGVLMNRLRRGQKLECDATVQYALGDGRKTRLMNEDLKVDSPYNTYLHAGLPPGPICNPGLASIRAAMNPASVPYCYYVAALDGSHVFSVSYEEHLAAIARIRREG